MAQLVILILDDLHLLPDLLAAWREAGVPGATILESVGAHRAENWLDRMGLGVLGGLFDADEIRRRTLLAAVTDEQVGRVVAETERVMGSLDRPDSGLLLVIPVTTALGLHKLRPPQGEAVFAAPDDAVRQTVGATTALEASKLLPLETILIDAEASLPEVIRAFLKQPGTGVGAVIDAEARLVGLLDAHTLADSLFVHVFPEEFLSDISDLDEVRRFADQTRAQRAQDIMRPPLAVRREDTVREAFHRMHKEGLSGLPIVDDAYRVEGYISILELLAVLSSIVQDAAERGPRA